MAATFRTFTAVSSGARAVPKAAATVAAGTVPSPSLDQLREQLKNPTIATLAGPSPISPAPKGK